MINIYTLSAGAASLCSLSAALLIKNTDPNKLRNTILTGLVAAIATASFLLIKDSYGLITSSAIVGAFVYTSVGSIHLGTISSHKDYFGISLSLISGAVLGAYLGFVAQHCMEILNGSHHIQINKVTVLQNLTNIQ